MRPDLYRYGRSALAVLLSATLACAGSPLAYAASASDDADGSASEFEAQEQWSDHIDDMLASGDYTEGEAVAIVAPSVADSAAAMLASADGDSEAASASSLLDEASEELSCTTGDVYEETFDEALPTAALEGPVPRRSPRPAMTLRATPSKPPTSRSTPLSSSARA